MKQKRVFNIYPSWRAGENNEERNLEATFVDVPSKNN